MSIAVVLHIKYFNLNKIQQTWHHITVNISTIFIPFFLKSFLPWRSYDFSLQRYLGPKGKIISNGLLYLSLSLSRSQPVTDSSMLVTRVLVSDERRQRFFFFFSTSTRRDVRISREKLGHSVFFFRNGGRHSRFSSAFNVTFDLSYLASHLSYRLQTKCILKWKSFVVKRMLKNDISVKIDTIPRVSKFREIIIFAWLEWILWRIINHVNLPAKRDKTENKTEGTENY